MHFTKFSSHFKLIALTILFSVFFWFTFYFNIPGKIGFNNVSLETIFFNYDGPNYMVISKCGYNKDCIGPNFSLPQPLEYYPAHLPAYPILINFISNFTSTPKAMLLSTLFGSIFLTLILFEFLKLFIKEKKAFWLSILFLFFPARLFILRQIGAPETWFLATIIASIFYFKKGKYLVAAIFAALAQSLKSPGILLFASYGIIAIYEFIKNKNFKEVFKKYFYFILTPIIIFAIFNLYRLQTGDFWAYFHSGDNFHLSKLPYLVFISTKAWINTIWLEDILYIYLIAMYGIYRLFKKYKFDIITIFPLVFTVATLLVAHRDISRYIAPVYPFLLLAFAKFLNKKPLKIIFIILIPAILLYAINFITGNIAPITDWGAFL
jgi:Gpi18-like mannosyltransferase